MNNNKKFGMYLIFNKQGITYIVKIWKDQKFYPHS